MVEPFNNHFTNRFTVEDLKCDDQSQIILGITTRHGGVSDSPYATLNMGFHVQDQPDNVLENRSRLSDTLNITLDNWVTAEQVHDKVIKKVTHHDGGKGARGMDTAVAKTDGLYTSDRDVLLTAFYADCVPLYFYSKKHGMIGIAHAGWRGTVKRIAQEMISVWTEEEGIPARDIEVVIGPAIDQCCYEVDQKVINEVRAVSPIGSNTQIYSDAGSGHYMLNLKELNRQLLLSSGVLNEHIYVSSYCTSCRTDNFYSHRKEQGKTGRMLGYIAMR